MAAQCATARAQLAAPAAIKRGAARARARGAAGRSRTRLGGRGVILASTGGGAPADADVARAPRPEYIPNTIDDPNYVRVFDTTLRDGEQTPGTNPTRGLLDRSPGRSAIFAARKPRLGSFRRFASSHEPETRAVTRARAFSSRRSSRTRRDSPRLVTAPSAQAPP